MSTRLKKEKNNLHVNNELLLLLEKNGMCYWVLVDKIRKKLVIVIWYKTINNVFQTSKQKHGLKTKDQKLSLNTSFYAPISVTTFRLRDTVILTSRPPSLLFQ